MARASKLPCEDAGPNANFVNRTLFQGDNLDYLRLLNSESVDLIATDPPFNKGQDFHSKPNSLADGGSFIDRWKWDDDVQQAWLDELKNVNRDKDVSLLKTIECVREAHSDAMGAYLCYMAVRLLAMRQVLKPTGAIFLHCDHTASHYLKMVMDAIFGRENFKNEIVWQYGSSGRGAKAIANQFPRNHDVILYYAKDRKKFKHNPVTEYDKYPIKNLPSHIKSEGRVYFKTSPRGDYTDKSIERLRKENRIYTTRNGNIRIKYFLESDNRFVYEPKLCGSVWNIPDMMHAPKKERTGYGTQKPLALYRRIIEAASNKDDVVLDPFCGCATTLIAAEITGRQWIGIDLWEDVYETVEGRLVNLKEADLEGSDGLVKEEGLPIFDTSKITRITNPSQIENPYTGESSAPYQESIIRHTYKKAPWEKLSDKQMVAYLSEAQANEKTGWVVCAGCGREMEVEFMELDHIHPKSDNEIHNISNRILICKPCNGRKSNKWAFKGLWDENKKADWMHDETKAKWAKEQQKRCYEKVRAELQ